MKIMKHNKVAIDRIINSYQNGNKKVLYVAGVGTGKTYVFMGLLEDMLRRRPNTRVLYIVPKYTIQRNIEEYDEFNQFKHIVDFSSYNMFYDIDKGMEIINGHDFVVIDEAHHICSDVFGNNIMECIYSKTNLICLGLTATPLRKDGINVTKFFDDRINGITVFEAIKIGFIPKINYRACIPDRILDNSYLDNPDFKFEINYNETEDVLIDILEKYPRNKWICFFKDINSIEENTVINKVFKDYKILYLHSNLNNVDYIIEQINTSDKVIVLSCNMLLEGVHLSGIDGIIMFRNVGSLVVFQQMIGRICSLNNTVEPVVIDCSKQGKRLLLELIKHFYVENESSSRLKHNNEDVIKIGIGSHKEYDIEKLLLKLDELNNIEVIMRNNAKIALEEYRRFSNIKYANYHEFLVENHKEFNKLKKCAELFGTSISMIIEEMNKPDKDEDEY